MKQVGVNNFARTRHTKFAPYSYFGGTEEELIALVEQNFDKAKPGYKEGVKLVPVPATNFFSGVCLVDASIPLRAEFKARREGEEPYVQVFCNNCADHKTPAKVVEVVVYHKDVLADQATEGAEWEVVSINARDTEEEEPQTPMAMARNMLNLPGGTQATYTAEQFAKAILYWSKRVMAG